MSKKKRKRRRRGKRRKPTQGVEFKDAPELDRKCWGCRFADGLGRGCNKKYEAKVKRAIVSFTQRCHEMAVGTEHELFECWQYDRVPGRRGDNPTIYVWYRTEPKSDEHQQPRGSRRRS